MTLVNIDLRNQGYETGPDDRVVFYSLLVREGDFGTISTAPVEVKLTDGQATVDLAPGPVGVQIIAGQVVDTRVKIGEVPPSGPTTLNAVMMVTPAYTPALQAQFLKAIQDAQAAAIGEIGNEVAVAVDAEMGAIDARSQEALTRSQNAETVAAGASSKATTASSNASNAVSRVVALEAMAGLSPESPVDGQTANLISQPSSLTHAAVGEFVSDVAPGWINAALPPAGLTPVVADGRYYDPAQFKYFSNAEMTVPATDNQPALQAMVDYLHNLGGGVIELPRGVMVTKSTVTWRSGVSMRGAGRQASLLCAEGEIFSTISHESGLSPNGSSGDDPATRWVDDVTFEGFGIDNKGLSYTAASVGGKGFFLLYMRRAVFRNLSISNTIGTGLGCDFLIDTVIDSVVVRNAGRNSRTGFGGNSGIGIGTAAAAKEPIVISNCFTYDCGNFGIFVETQNNPENDYRAMFAKIVNCHAEGNYRGFGNKGSGATQFIGCTAANNTKMGFELLEYARGDSLIGCVSRDNGGDGVQIGSTYLGSLSIVGCAITGNVENGINFAGVGSSSPLKDVLISSSRISFNGFAGVYAPRPLSGISFTSNVVEANGSRATVSQHRRGFYAGSTTAERFSLVGNTFSDSQETKTQLAAVQILPNISNVLISGNNCPGYTETEAYSVPTSAVKTGNSPSSKMTGVAEIPDGSTSVWVTHSLGGVPREISITPMGDFRVWVSASEANRFRLMRPADSTGSVSVMWKAEK